MLTPDVGMDYFKGSKGRYAARVVGGVVLCKGGFGHCPAGASCIYVGGTKKVCIQKKIISKYHVVPNLATS